MAQKWFKLDTAALIFPAAMTEKWSNCYRLSARLKNKIDPEILQRAADDLRPRFPTFYVKLRAGFFWYRLEDAGRSPAVRQDFAYPLTHMGKKELREICFRVLYYEDRIAAEFFHSITDGNGGLVYFKNLLNRYLELETGIKGGTEHGILELSETPPESELKESFFENSCGYAPPRVTGAAFRMKGTRTEKGMRRLLTGTVLSDRLVEISHEHGCSVTAFLTALMIKCMMRIQKEDRRPAKYRPVRVSVPVNLRKLYGGNTLRNFVLALDIGADPRLGEYSLKELCSCVGHQLKYLATPQYMAGQITANTMPQKNMFIRLVPLPLKNVIMNMVYNQHGEKGSCIALSNLGNADVPENIINGIRNLDFIIGVQKSYPNNCSVISCGGKTRINFIRNIRETRLERYFFTELVELGVPVEIESDR